MGTLSSIDLGPLKEVVAYPQLRKLVDLNDIDVDGLFKMDKDLDGHLQRSEYPSDKDAEFILVKERVENVGRELEARKQGLFSPDATSLKNCNAVLKEIEQTKSLPPANVIFFCRGEMLLLASKTVAILELSSDKRADAIISAMQENLPQAIKFIKYAPEAERFRLYSLAYSYEMDKRGSAENGLIGKCRILDESKNITDENLRSAMYWMGMKDDDPSVILHALQILATPEVVAIGLENDSPHVMNEAIELIPEMPVEKQGGFVDIVLKKFIKHSADISSLNEDYFISYFMGGFLRMIPRIKDAAARQKAFKEVLQVTYDERQRQYFKNAVVAISWLPYEEYGEYGELIELAVRNQGIEWVLQELDKTWKPSDSEEKVRDRLHKAFDRRQKEIEVNSEEDIPSGDCSIMRL